MKRIGIGILFLVFAAQASRVEASAACRRLFAKRKFVQAGQCYERVAKGISVVSTTTQRLKKGRALTNAALCYANGARRAKKRREAAWLYERSVILLRRYELGKLYPSIGARNQVRVVRRRYRIEIGYASLSVVTNQTTAKICIIGYRYRGCTQSIMWNRPTLRPGRYQIVVTYSKTVVRRKQIDLGPQQRETIIFNPPEAGGRATVVTNDKDAIVTISGANLEKPIREKASFLIKPLPPGKYKITVKYPGGTIRKKDFTMSRGKSTSLVFTPPGQPGIKLQTTPRGVSVFVVKPKSKDKKARERYRGKTDLRLLLNVGEHRLRFKKTCYLPQEQSVQVQNDSEKLLKLDFVRDPVYLKWKKREDRIPVSRAWGWILTSVGIVGLISGTGFTIGANNSHEQALRERQLNGDDYSQFAAEGNAFRTISLFGFGVGGASMVAGIVFLVNSQSVPFARVPCKVRLAEDE